LGINAFRKLTSAARRISMKQKYENNFILTIFNEIQSTN